MQPRLFMIHTVASLLTLFEELVMKHMPEWRVANIIDESLLRDTIDAGCLTSATKRRLIQHVWSASDAGAAAILVTCSSMGPAVDTASELCSVPVIRVDQGMVDRAVANGSRIGVVATLSSTLLPTQALVERRAAALGKRVSVNARLCEGAFAALAAGDRTSHDQQVSAAMIELASTVDILILAQASMARILYALPSDAIGIPVLSSPELGVMHMKTILAEADKALVPAD